MNRNLDGVYFRVKRGEKYENICFSDMTEDERDKIMEDKPVEWLKAMCEILASTLRGIGDQFNIEGE